MQQILFDSANFIGHNCNIKNEQIYYYLLLKGTVKLYQLSTSFQVNSEVYLNMFQNYFCTLA